ncbi:MAG: M20 metallopeptidase family protein, partial [Fusobacteriaceae bacterium]
MIKKLVSQNKDYIIKMRREFHKYPEPSFEEFRTSKRIQEELSKMGIPFKVVAGTGVVGFINKGKIGKKIALRADMDALQVQECNELDYCSVNTGIMHACGHDGHSAMLLGAAKVLNEIKEELE